MTRVACAPFLRADPKLVSCEAWQSAAGSAVGPLGGMLPHWDYNTDLRIVRTLSVDAAALRQACGLGSDARLRVAVVWRSTGSNVRGRGDVHELAGGQEAVQMVLQATIPARLLSGDVRIATQIVLAAGGNAANRISAQFPGSILWEDVVLVQLEGAASRFPMEVVDFSKVNWAPYRAGWYTWWNSDQLHEPFLRNVRLFLNASHPAVVGAVQAAAPTPEQRLVQSAIYYDVGRSLLRGALHNEEFVADPSGFPEGSTGAAIVRLLNALFSGETPKKLRSLMVERPDYFDSRLQGSLRLFAEP